MNKFPILYFLFALVLMTSCVRDQDSPGLTYLPSLLALTNGEQEDGLTPIESLGEKLFSDSNLSEPAGQACQSCHDPANGYATPSDLMNHGVSQGAIATRFGNRNAPTASYAAFAPNFQYDLEAQTWIGGMFHDQRAESLEEQAKGPFLNPLEMNNPDKETVVLKVKQSDYSKDFINVFGAGSFDDVDSAYNKIAAAIAAYERSSHLNPFNSKFDAYLKGKAQLSPSEIRGLAIFRNPSKGNCDACHPSTGEAPLFTDFTNDNLGIPKNPNLPFYTMSNQFNPDGANYIDNGLGANSKVNDSMFNGRIKVPTLRNVAITGPYMHNGYFKSLRDVVRFYNTACAPGNPDHWPAAEVEENRNCTEMGNLGLTDSEIDDLVNFLNTLTDGFMKK